MARKIEGVPPEETAHSMNINFNPVSLERKASSLRVIITHKGKVYRRTTGLMVDTKSWSKTKQRSGTAKTDARIREIRASARLHLVQ